MPKFTRVDAHISMVKEKGGLRKLDSTLDEAISVSYPIDKPEEGEFPVLRTVLKREERFTLGGDRRTDYVAELGYDPVDESVNFYLQTAKFIYGAFGSCVTTGTSYAPAKTGTIDSGGGTKILTVTGIVLTPDAHIGDMLEITVGDRVGNKYEIVDNDASTITVDINTPINIDADQFEIKTVPFLHHITHAKILPTFAMKFDMPDVLNDERILMDLLGIIIKSHELTIEQGGDAIQAVGIIGAKSVEGNPITNPAEPLDTPLKWGHLSELDLSYDGENPIRAEICDSITITTENDSEIKPVVGDFWSRHQKDGTVTDMFRLHYFPDSKLLYDLRNTCIKDLVDDIDLTLKLKETNCAGEDFGDYERYIKWVVTKMYVAEHPTGIPSKDDHEMGVDCTLMILPEGDIYVEAQDAYGLIHYEGSTPTPDGE